MNHVVGIFQALPGLMDAAVRVGATFHVKHSSGASTQGSLPNERLPTKPGSASTRVPRARGNPQSYPQRYPPLFPRRSASRSTARSSRKASSRRPSGRAAAMSAEARTGSSGDPIRPPGVRGGRPRTLCLRGKLGVPAGPDAGAEGVLGCDPISPSHPASAWSRNCSQGTVGREGLGARIWGSRGSFGRRSKQSR